MILQTTTTTTTTTTLATFSSTKTGMTSSGGKKLVNEEITETVNDFETATEFEGSEGDCPSCTCECASATLTSVTDLSNSPQPHATATILSNAKSDHGADEKFVDLLDIYNQSDLDNGIFNDGMYV